MSSISVQRRLQYLLAQLGRVGSLGLGLLLLALLGWFTLIQGGEKELEATRLKLQALQQQAAVRSSLPLRSALGQEEQLQVFYQGFPKAAQVPDALQDIYSAAAQQDLLLETGEYNWLQTGNERLARMRIALPVKGSFQQVLGFMDRVLLANPRLALENASFKRDKVDDPLVEAKLVFVVFVDTQP